MDSIGISLTSYRSPLVSQCFSDGFPLDFKSNFLMDVQCSFFDLPWNSLGFPLSFDPIRISNCCSTWLSLFLSKGTNLDVQWMSVDVRSHPQSQTSRDICGCPQTWRFQKPIFVCLFCVFCLVCGIRSKVGEAEMRMAAEDLVMASLKMSTPFGNVKVIATLLRLSQPWLRCNGLCICILEWLL